MSDVQTLTVEDIEPNDEGPSRLQKTARWSGYGLFFLVALLVSLILNFPNRQLKGFIEGQARKAGYPLTIESLRLSGLSSMTISGVKVTLPAGKSRPGKPGLPPATVRFDEINASTALWPLVTRSEIDATLDMRVGGGSIEQGRLNVRRGPSQTQSASTKGRSKKKAKARRRSALLVDIDIPSIDGVDLRELGISSRMLGFTSKVGGSIDGTLSGSINLHWEGRPDGARGNIDLELTDALLRAPTVAIDAKGPPLALQDLRLGVLTLKVRIDEKGRINLLKSKRGVDSATAIHLAGVDIFGPDIELVAEERSHIIIPPGRRGLNRGRVQFHLVFSLPKGKSARKKKTASSDRASWDLVRQMVQDKYKRFMRAGYLGMTCSGSLLKPTCTPSLPQVTVGTRKQARSDARKKAKTQQVKAPKAKPAKKSVKAKPDAGSPAPKSAQPAKAKKPAFKPIMRPGASKIPPMRPSGAAKRAVKVKQSNKPRKARDTPARGADDDEGDGDDERDDDDDDGDDDDDDDDKDSRRGKRGDDDDNDDDDERDEDDDDDVRKGGKRKGKAKAKAKDEDEDEDEDE